MWSAFWGKFLGGVGPTGLPLWGISWRCEFALADGFSHSLASWPVTEWISEAAVGWGPNSRSKSTSVKSLVSIGMKFIESYSSTQRRSECTSYQESQFYQTCQRILSSLYRLASWKNTWNDFRARTSSHQLKCLFILRSQSRRWSLFLTWVNQALMHFWRHLISKSRLASRIRLALLMHFNLRTSKKALHFLMAFSRCKRLKPA